MAAIDGLKRYAAANDEVDEAVLSQCMEAAMQSLEAAGVRQREQSSLYDLAVYMLAVHYFDNRGVIQENGGGELPFGLQGIVHQLRYEQIYDGQGAST